MYEGGMFMDENKIDTAMNDKRVKMNELYDGKINIFSAIPEGEMKGIIIYCHGLGSNKKWATRFYNRLLENKLGIYAFDFPGHGEDNTEFSQFTLNSCISYLNDVISYVGDKYNVPIYLFGCSFGGFVILNRLIVKNDDIKSTILMCPAINFCEIMEGKSGISNDYFNTNEYMPLYNNIKIYEQAYIEFKNGDLQLKNSKFNNISIIQGTLDKTVDYKNIEKFCEKNNLNLFTIQEGKHELYGHDDEIVDFLISMIN